MRVVKFAGIGPGPYADMLLADLSAEVIVIDRPGAMLSSSKNRFLSGRWALR
ncbi:CoA transferase [Alicycliphilus sp. T452]